MKLRLWWFSLWLLCVRPALAQTSEPPPPEPLGEPDASSEGSADQTVETLDTSELEALGLEQEDSRVDTDLHFWGFADFTSSMLIRPKGATAFAQGRYQNFYVGNVNLYLSKNLSESFRTMGEVRFTYLPNGSFTYNASGISQIDTSTVDYANGQSVTRWGGIILQRIYLEWTLHRFITVRGGQFLTPLGIWNVDHGSPVYIPAERPLPITLGLFPERQTGLEVVGHWSANNENSFGYHLTLSNGTGPISEYKDLDRNKAIGGRLYWENFGAAYVRGGISAYYGRDTNATPTANLMGGKADLANKITGQSDLLVLATDVLVTLGGLHLQTEWITSQRRYTDSGRVVHTVYQGPVARAASADSFAWAGYVLAAYRFGWYSLTPYATGQVALQSNSGIGLPDLRFKLNAVSAGVTVRPIDSVVFKLEYGAIRLPGSAYAKGTINVTQLQIAWAF